MARRSGVCIHMLVVAVALITVTPTADAFSPSARPFLVQGRDGGFIARMPRSFGGARPKRRQVFNILACILWTDQLHLWHDRTYVYAYVPVHTMTHAYVFCIQNKARASLHLHTCICIYICVHAYMCTHPHAFEPTLRLMQFCFHECMCKCAYTLIHTITHCSNVRVHWTCGVHLTSYTASHATLHTPAPSNISPTANHIDTSNLLPSAFTLVCANAPGIHTRTSNFCRIHMHSYLRAC